MQVRWGGWSVWQYQDLDYLRIRSLNISGYKRDGAVRPIYLQISMLTPTVSWSSLLSLGAVLIAGCTIRLSCTLCWGVRSRVMSQAQLLKLDP